MRPRAHVNRKQGRRTHAKLEWSGKKSNRIKIDCNKTAWIMEGARCDAVTLWRCTRGSRFIRCIEWLQQEIFHESLALRVHTHKIWTNCSIRSREGRFWICIRLPHHTGTFKNKSIIFTLKNASRMNINGFSRKLIVFIAPNCHGKFIFHTTRTHRKPKSFEPRFERIESKYRWQSEMDRSNVHKNLHTVHLPNAASTFFVRLFRACITVNKINSCDIKQWRRKLYYVSFEPLHDH